jgi:fermentation-respiration switch protein FrsA (DUF1100 family)
MGRFVGEKGDIFLNSEEKSMKSFILVFLMSVTFPQAMAMDSGDAQSFRAYDQAVQERLSDPRLSQGLISSENYEKVVKIAENYRKRNSLNPGWLNIFRTWNSGETLQNRTALENRRNNEMMIFDMDRGQPMDWSQVQLDQDSNPSVSQSQFAMALDRTHISDPDAPVVLILLSNQHILNDYLSNNAPDELRKMGVVMAAMEYPGFGVSIGCANKASWLQAVHEAVAYLHFLTGKKIYVLGHSIGGPLSLEASSAPEMNDLVAGALSYGGFTSLIEQSKDQESNPVINFFSKPIGRVVVGKNNIDGLSALDRLARNGIRTLVMHGQNDGPVPVRHALLYQEKMKKLQLELQDMRTAIFPGLAHEEVNNFSLGIQKSEEGFHKVWNEIIDFIRRSNLNLAPNESHRLSR